MLKYQKIDGPARKFTISVPEAMCEAIDKYAIANLITRVSAINEFLALALKEKGIGYASANGNAKGATKC